MSNFLSIYIFKVDAGPDVASGKKINSSIDNNAVLEIRFVFTTIRGPKHHIFLYS